MKTALASDFDNTIYFMFQNPQYRPGDCEAIRAYQARGGLFGISTGRSLWGLTLSMQDDIVPDFYILNGGGQILDKDRHILFEETIPAKTVQDLLDRYQHIPCHVNAGSYGYTFEEANEFNPHIDSLDDIAGQPIYGMGYYPGTDDKAIMMADEINRLYAGNVQAYANTQFIDVVPTGCSKGTSVRKVKEYFCIDLMAGIGDAGNDFPMLQLADIGLTFPYAPTFMQEKADYVVQSIDEAISCVEGHVSG